MISRAPAAALVVVVAAAACGHDAASPTAPTTRGAEPTARLAVTVDSLGSTVAIRSVSKVRFDATGSFASDGPVRYQIDYGDGASGEGQTTEHVYTASGAYTASITLVDARGRRAAATHTVNVRAVEGTWFHAGYNTSTARVEIRKLTLTAQNGRSIVGEFTGPRAEPVPVNATLDGERTLRFLTAGAQVEGTVPSAVFEDAAIMPLRGFAHPDAELHFVPIVGEPSSPPPVAELDLQIDSYRSPVAILALSPIRFSANASSGERPLYIFEFGDGGFSTSAEPTTIHPCNAVGTLDGRVTVVDRFARSSSRSRSFFCADLRGYGGSWFSTSGERRVLWFQPYVDRSVEGFYGHPNGGGSHFTGVLTGERSIRMVLDGGGIEFTGDIIVGSEIWYRYMNLTLKGGSADGQTLQFLFYEPY